ncbi:helix-turn-helix transcriptional regulator [Streptomyces sp. NPDC048389]|uniref:helix-turn-helix domain-containing protein n=1 Tax=Streptomyces sp. NPDC048389 TaxID=3154622 RepID=UPI003453BE2F
MEQLDWMARVSKTVARELRRHRQARGMSAQQLADACEALGAPIPRTVISNIENGRRGQITFAEVCLLAAALKIPPTVLGFPVGYLEEVEYLPGKMASPLEAADWWNGEPGAEEWALTALRKHHRLESQIRRLYKQIWEQAIADYRWQGEPGGPEASAAREVAEELTAELHELRDEIAGRGLVLPPLPGLDRPA